MPHNPAVVNLVFRHKLKHESTAVSNLLGVPNK